MFGRRIESWVGDTEEVEMARWNKEGYDPKHIVKILEEAKILKDDGKVTFGAFEHLECAVVLKSMVQLNRDIPDVEKARLIDQATFEAGQKGRITESSLLREMSRLESEYLARPARPYRLVTSISARRSFSGLRRARVGRCTISFSDYLPKSFEKAARQQREKAKGWFVGAIPDKYTHVRVSVAAKSHAAAVNQALDALDLIRGIWNLFWNRRRGSRMSSGRREPVNRLTLGPIHTLHEPDGNLATELWWYDPGYLGPVRPHDPSREMEKLLRFTSDFRGLLTRSKYRTELESAVLRYTRALDSGNWEDAFLKLWGVVEYLTNTGFTGYKVTVRRASSLFRDWEYARQILMHLRDYRNRSVHAGSENHEIETCLYQLKRFVEALIEFHLGNKCWFKSLADAADFMDLPCDRNQLRSKVRLLAYARKFRGYR